MRGQYSQFNVLWAPQGSALSLRKTAPDEDGIGGFFFGKSGISSFWSLTQDSDVTPPEAAVRGVPVWRVFACPCTSGIS